MFSLAGSTTSLSPRVKRETLLTGYWPRWAVPVLVERVVEVDVVFEAKPGRLRAREAPAQTLKQIWVPGMLSAGFGWSAPFL